MTPVIEEPAHQQRLRGIPRFQSARLLLLELVLHRDEEFTAQDGFMVCWADGTAVDHLADIEAVAEQVSQWTAGERNAADGATIRERAHLGDDALVVQILQQLFKLPSSR